MNRRGFLGFSLAAVGGIFVPKYAGWFRQGSGIIVPAKAITKPQLDALEGALTEIWREVYEGYHVNWDAIRRSVQRYNQKNLCVTHDYMLRSPIFKECNL